MVIKLITSVALLYAAMTVNAQDDVARSSAGCGLLTGNIFCFGGVRGNMTTSIATDTTMYMLDLSKNASMAELQGNWTLIQPNTNGVTVETRLNPQFAVISDSQMIFNGGFGGSGDNVPIQDQTIAYDASTNSWSKYANYNEAPYGDRQIYYGASAYVPDLGAVFYGGFEEHVNTTWTISDTTQNITATYFSGNMSRVIGFVDATFLNINDTNVWNVPSPQTNAPSVFSAFQTSVYSPSDKRVYYLGGTYQDTTVEGYQPSVFANWHPMTYALYYDISTNTWGNQTLQGSIIPTSRMWHTLTILPNEPTKMLLYGGEGESAVATDFCFLLDLQSFTWTQVNFSIPSDGSDLLRSRQSDVKLGNDTLFMIFGLTSTGQTTSRPIAFNISSSASIAYMSDYTAPASATSTSNNAPSSSNGSDVSNSKPSSGGLSSGAIAGIAVGAAAAVIIIAVALFFFLRKKKNGQKKQKGYEKTTNASESVNHSQENIEVNWDEIEKNYVEVPAPGSDSGRIMKPDESKTDETSTYIVSHSSEGSVGQGAQQQANISHNIQTTVETTSVPYLIMKPDGANQEA